MRLPVYILCFLLLSLQLAAGHGQSCARLSSHRPCCVAQRFGLPAHSNLQVVLNRAAEVEEQERQAAAASEQAAADVDMQDAEQQTVDEAAEEEHAVPEAAPAWQPRVVVLGRLHKAISTAERAGEVVVVRPTHLVAPQAQPAAAPEVVVLPASTRKTPGPSAIKRARTPAPSAAKGRTPAAAPAKTPATVATTATKSATAAKSARKSIGGLAELPKSMVNEAPGECLVAG